MKTEIKENAATIGHVPLRSSRFLRFTGRLINEWSRTNTCNKKRQRSVSNSPHASKKRRIAPSTSLRRHQSVLWYIEIFSKWNTEIISTTPCDATVSKQWHRVYKSIEVDYNSIIIVSIHRWSKYNRVLGKHTQFIFFDTHELISENSNVPRIQHDNIIGKLYQRDIYSLLVINMKKKSRRT